MKFWNTVMLSAALAAAATAGAAYAPVVHGQSRTPRAAAPPMADVFSIGNGSRLGVTIKDVDPEDPKAKSGVIVESVDDDSPAAKGGLKQGDVVVEFDGERVRSVRQFTRLVSETPSGHTVTAGVMRDGARVSVNVTPRDNSNVRFLDGEGFETLRRFSAAPPAIAAMPARPTPAPMPPAIESFIWRSSNRLGITTGDLSPQLRDYFGAKAGVLVTSVEDGSAASRAGIKAGDVMTSVNGQTIDTPADVRREIGRIDAGAEFSIDVVRDKKPITVKGKLTESGERRRTGRAIL